MPMGLIDPTLVCFALPEEAAPFRRAARGRPAVQVRVTGMGRRNAAAALAVPWPDFPPRRVFTCGFAGGLDPALQSGDVLFEASPDFPGVERLREAGASPARFHCADRMAVTAAEKRALRVATGADAVEMESAAIHAACREAGLPCATVRVISDPAEEDLPLDFNRFVRPDQSLDLSRLLWAVACRPRLIGPLLRLQRTTRAAAIRLSEVLVRAMRQVLAPPA